MTFTLVGNLADFGADPRAGVRVRIVGTPRIKVDDGTIYSDQPETVTTDSTGAFTADLISTPGLWYRVSTPFVRAINPVHVAAYTPDPDDPTTGVAFAAGVTVDLADVMDEDPTPGYDGVFLGGGGGVPTAHTHPASGISDSTATGRAVLTAATQADARTAIGAGTSSLVVGTGAGDAKAGNYQPTAANISDSTATGRTLITATDAGAARTAIGAGTSSLAIGTTAGTAAEGNDARLSLSLNSKAKTDGTDETSKVQAELDQLRAAGGGTLVLPGGTVTINGTLTLGNDGATPPKQPALRIVGQGTHWSGRGTAPVGGTILDITGSDPYGKLKTNGLGLLAIHGVTFRDLSADDTPFIYTTNTTLHIAECSFVGSKITGHDQDCVILGGPDQVEGGAGWSDGFQGYGSLIEDCFFSNIRRGVVGQAFANAVKVERLTAWTTCGNANGGFIEWDGKPSGGVQVVAGGTISDCLIEMTRYKYGIVLHNTIGMDLRGNSFYDYDATVSTAGILLDTTATGNRVLNGASVSGTKPAVIDLSGRNIVSPIEQGIPTVHAARQVYPFGVTTTSSDGRGGVAMNPAGHCATVRAVFTSSYAAARIGTAAATSVTDAATTSGSNTITSATAAFTVADQGTAIGGTGIPSGTRITAVVNATTAILTKAATATATGVTVTFGRPDGTLTEQVHFGRQHWQALGAAPTASVGAGTGSGGTATLAGTDVTGRLTITTGTTPTAGVLGSWTPAITYVGSARVQLTPRNAATAALFVTGVWVGGTTGSQSINTVAAPAASTVYEFDYLALES